ncbi:MAG: T9SS type A sorting domain-containing protein [Flavobacteriales bacterium]|nr:T9SS type A sorting domain-containing protein [Flavobacteriales bacterium]
MKKLYKLFLGLMVVGTAANAQVVFQSNLSSWNAGLPTDMVGPATSLALGNITEVSADTYGTSAAQLKNTSTSHKRVTTFVYDVTPNETYEIKIWVKGLSGEIRTGYKNVTTTTYTYNSYFDMAVESNGSLVELMQTVTVAATCDSAEFILSLRSTDDVNDIILDSIYIGSTAPPVATPYTINQIQFTTTPPYDSPHNGEFVETTGIVTAVQYNGYYLQDGNGPWNGIFVLDFVNIPNIGDEVTISGNVEEYFNLTEIKNPTAYAVNSTGNTLPTPTVLTTLGANDEQYEGVLVKVNGATCTADTTVNGFGEWTINDGSGALVVDDKMYVFAPTQSVDYNVTGVMDYSFSVFKLLPRDMNDVVISTSIEEIKNIKVSVYPNPVKDNISFELSTNNYQVQIFDITGKTIKQASSLRNKLTLSTTELNNGIYFYSIFTKDGSLITTNKFIVAQ